jgi:hypothetical protein
MSRSRVRTNHVWMLALILWPGFAQAQLPNSIGVRANSWVLASGSLGFDEDYSGWGGTLGYSWTHVGARAAVAHVSEHGVDPGWLTLTGELEPKLKLAALELGGRIGFGGHHMRNEGRRRAAERCRNNPGCLFEAESYNPGWSSIVEGDAMLGVRVHRFRASASVGRVKLVGGVNSGVTMRKAGIGVEYVWR